MRWRFVSRRSRLLREMILCLGPTPALQRNMTFTHLMQDGVNRTTEIREYASGKCTNTARALHTLGKNPLVIGFLGGPRGAIFREDLNRVGIAHDFVEVAAPTRLCITLIDQAQQTATELIEESHAITPADADRLIEQLPNHLARAKQMVIAGSLPPGIADDFYARCLQIVNGRIPVVLDAVGPPLLKALAHQPTIAKPNRSELGRTLNTDVSSDAELHRAMCELVSRGAKWVVVTDGSRGTTLTDGQTFWRLSTPAIKVISAIGSGDSFAAGLAAGLADGLGIPQACALAVGCGAANAMTPYAGHLLREDVLRLVQEIKIES